MAACMYTVDQEIFVYENFQGKFQLYPRKLFYRKFFYMQARSKNLLCWRLPCIICDIQEAAIGTRL